MNEKDKKETQKFTIKNILIQNCGKQLTPDIIDEVYNQMIKEMYSSPCSWAFK